MFLGVFLYKRAIGIKIKHILRCKIIIPIMKFFDRYVERKQNVYNINFDICSRSSGKVLVSYITAGLLNKNRSMHHTNIKESLVIIKYFIDRGYAVDIFDCNDQEHLSEIDSYDIIFGFGAAYKRACELNKDAKKIAYLTECAPNMSYKNEAERIEYYFKRHGIKIGIERSGVFFKNDEICFSDDGLFMGNEFTAIGYKEAFPNMHISFITPSGMYNNTFVYKDKQSKKECNFLWFGSSGAVHKGLDILLDVFQRNTECHLYVCGLNSSEKWLMRQYRKCMNIHECGFVDVQSSKYLELLDKVAFVILPSAAEGMATSVLTCMRHGLIPIVTVNTGITLKNFGVSLEDFHIEYMMQVVKCVSEYSIERINEERSKVYEYANEEFSLMAYKSRLYSALDKIIDAKE